MHLFVCRPCMNVFGCFVVVGRLHVSACAHPALGLFLLPAVEVLTCSARCAMKFRASRPTNREAPQLKSSTGDRSVGRASDCRIVQTSDGPWLASGSPDLYVCGTGTDMNTTARRRRMKKLPFSRGTNGCNSLQNCFGTGMGMNTGACKKHSPG